MATKTIQVCDLCADDNYTNTSKVITIDGREFEVDVCTEHEAEWDQLEAQRRRFAEAGRPRTEAPKPTSINRSNEDREENRAIRAWAKERGYELSDRGRIPADLRARFREEDWHKRHPVPTPPLNGDAALGFPEHMVRP